MKKLIFLFASICMLSACASSYDSKKEQKKAQVDSSLDPKMRLPLLDNKQMNACKKPTSNSCINIYTHRALIHLYWTQDYNSAVKNAETAIYYYKRGYDYAARNDGAFGGHTCNSYWQPLNTFTEPEISDKQMPKTVDMIYYLALKAAKDPRAKENITIAHLCELSRTYREEDKNVLLQNYLKESKLMENATDHFYTKRFINEIYKPIQTSLNQFDNEYKKSTENSRNDASKILKAKEFVLYKNALIHAQKIGLPQIYQDYLRYNERLNKPFNTN
ncbi:hypothetical protein [Acinetobacter johnsonii]|uniref:hypothetical protein n=1 Tax=Acinetobacter johnsonii TaxID=40214 RepID=UPI0032B3DA92